MEKENLKPNEVEIIQYLRPDGIRRRMIAVLNEDYAKRARNLVISAELLPGNMIAFYVSRADELDYEETHVYPNDTSNPEVGNEILKELIDKCS